MISKVSKSLYLCVNCGDICGPKKQRRYKTGEKLVAYDNIFSSQADSRQLALRTIYLLANDAASCD